MWQIFKKDFLDAFKTKKNIFVYIVFLGLAYVIAKNKTVFVVNPDPSQLPLFGSVDVMLLIFGLLIAGALFGGIVSGEVDRQTIRFIVPYVSRVKIYVAKFLAIFVYLILLSIVSIGFVLIYRQTFKLPWLDITMLFVTFLYVAALLMLISSLFNQEKLSVFTAAIVGIVLPILALINMLQPNNIINFILKLTPFGYLEPANWGSIASVLALSVAFTVLGGLIFSRKEV
ncbi:ABC transporter permease [Weissella viridescens]|jgi:ABC-type transport system involved in multi-copper enzyme maturation permease subunit|uniref:ABC transporter permease n=1 Tax=Weissella viridescens TaxID=1629 RepID=UPI00116C50A3|nr:ABC transporter permease subunit [Weissella viridescens]MBX4172119.1 ABC transporter permease [Weissella viridescens]QOD85694.1 ABC transporter permease subunit [Weissella viridescens]WJI90808.1 ABC transporter permease subunit [Weissella viridescens]GEA94717.1 hypothetical protein WVI01_06400 [Weissella viridescens]